MACVRFIIVLTLWAPIPASLLAASKLLDLAGEIPGTPDLSLLQAPYASRVETLDGWHLAGSRTTGPVPYEELPPTLIAAVLAGEDEDFFSHSAFNSRAILRAGYANLKSGEKAQGASTITQQVAKQFLGNEKTYERKLKELLIARRLEANYTKREILDAYLRSVYLGHRAEGVTNASWHYFNKDPRELELHEATTLAGILPAPSVYNPLKSPESAKRERSRVLRRMTEMGMITELERAEATERPVSAGTERLISPMPEAFSAAQRLLNDHYEGDAWGTQGITVAIPYEPEAQSRAREALRGALIDHDKRQGFRGALGSVEPSGDVVARLKAQRGRYQLGVVQNVEENTLRVLAAKEFSLTIEDNDWAAPSEDERHFKRPAELKDFTRILQANDLVFVDTQTQSLVQWPEFEGAILALDSASGRVLAGVGGFDTATDQFDRAFLACRQPGSVFKPIVYSEALSRHLTPATMLSDVPLTVANRRGEVWTPRNADRNFKGYITLANALAWSRNVPTVNLMRHLGAESVVARARKLGVQSLLDPTDSMSLGSSCMHPWEVARIYLAFQNRGHRMDVHGGGFFRTQGGKIEHDQLEFSDPAASLISRLDRMASIGPEPAHAVSSNIAFVMLSLLRRVVTSGTASKLPKDWLMAGKTGTTNSFDGWFVGLDGHTTVVTWLGSDKNTQPLGKGENGGSVALPMFQTYYEPIAVLAKDGDHTWPTNPPKGIEYVAIDPSTGLRAPPHEYGVPYPFVLGTAPLELSPTRGTKQAQKFDQLMYDF